MLLVLVPRRASLWIRHQKDFGSDDQSESSDGPLWLQPSHRVIWGNLLDSGPQDWRAKFTWTSLSKAEMCDCKNECFRAVRTCCLRESTLLCVKSKDLLCEDTHHVCLISMFPLQHLTLVLLKYLLDGWMNRWMDGWISGWMLEWMDGLGGLRDGWGDRWRAGWGFSHLFSNMVRFPALLLSRGPNKQDPPRKHRGPLLNMFNFRDDTDFVFKSEVYVYSTKTMHVWNSNLTKNKVEGLIINVSIRTF